MARERRGHALTSGWRRPGPRPWLLLLAVAVAASMAGCMCLPAPSPSPGGAAWADAQAEATVAAPQAPAATTTGAASPPIDPTLSRTSFTQEPPTPTVAPSPDLAPPSVPAIPQPPRPDGPPPLGSGPSESTPAPAADIRAPSIPTSAEYPIDLSTALRLAERENPLIAEVRARIGEALGNQLRARAEMLPGLNAGADYDGHAGNLQRSSGQILNLSRQSVYVGGGAYAIGPMSPLVPAVFLLEPLANAIYDPLAAHQMVHVARFDAAATTNAVLLEVARYYLELLGATARLEADRRSADEAEELMRITERYARTGEGRPADFHRAETEWRIRRAEVRRAEEDKAVASARLCRRLHLDPSVQIRPLSDTLEVLALIDLDCDVQALIGTALGQRPEIKAAAANLAAARIRHREEVARPFLPSLFLGFSGGAFGGGSNLNPPTVGNFAGRTDFDVAAYWTLANLGFGNLAAQKERRAMAGAATARQARTIALVREEVASALGDARARREQVEIARERLATAADGFRRDLERARGAVPDHQGRTPRPIEVINSLKLLVEARRKLVETIIDYDQSQFQLFVAMGAPPPLQQPTDPDRPPVAIRALAAPVTDTPASDRGAEAAPGAAGPPPTAANALADAESGLARTLQQLNRAAGPAGAAGQFADLAKAHQKSMDALLEYDRLQEELLRSVGAGTGTASSAEQLDRLLKLGEAHRELMKSKVEYDATLWGLVRTLSTKGQGTAPTSASGPTIIPREVEDAATRTR